MGKLNNNKLAQSFANWVLPVLIVLFCFWLVDSRIIANPAPSTSELEAYLEDNELEVGTKSIDGYQQIYYVYEDINVVVTKSQNNHTQPKISGQYMVWVETIEGFPQIVFYDLLEKTRLQITQTGTNISPEIDGRKIVWEGLDNGVQQIFYFDGKQIRQISDDFYSSRPTIKEEEIAYAQFTGNQPNPWRVMLYKIDPDENEDQLTIINEGGESEAWPRFEKNKIETNFE